VAREGNWEDNLRTRDKILIVLSRKHCLSLEELENYTGVKRNVLKVYLSLMARQGIITRTWGSFGGKKYRKYCLKTAIKEALGLD
jgi:DNA-binding IscR family transcriptional regulator